MLCKISKTIQLKVEFANLYHHLRQKHTVGEQSGYGGMQGGETSNPCLNLVTTSQLL